MKSRGLKSHLLVASLLICCMPVHAALLLDEPLQGSTSGTRIGGTFANGGFQITGQYDSIYWHLAYPVHRGTAEFYVKGLNANECRSWMSDKTELYHMYDWTYDNSDIDYSGYRDNPYKHYLRKIGCVGGTTNAMELLWKVEYPYEEPDSGVLGWNSGTNYHFTETWYPDGNGNSVIEIRRDGQLLRTMSLQGCYNPQGPTIRIGASSRRFSDYGAPLDAVYSYVKVWDDSTSVPETPMVTAPAPGGSTHETSPRIIWAYTPASKYQVRLNTANDPNSSIFWDSGTVVSNQNWCITGPVANLQNYYVFVRLWNGAGWSAWSATGHLITVNTGYTVPNNGVVTISGRSFYDNNGQFLGLGATYMRAMRDCKYNRDRFRSNCAFIASQGFNYIRILSMVGWTSKPIAPLDFTNSEGIEYDAWPDYWQQFRDCIDIAYEYGLRTEVVVFADAQNCMPNEANRYAHMDDIVGNVNGRDHKVIFIEVANEYWQNGLNVTQLRDYGAYLNARIGRLIALSSSGPDSLTTIYNGIAADIATEHTDRNTGTFEGGWLPVRSSWSLLGTPGVPAAISNDEPIGPGSSVSTENDPIKLVSAACFSWIAGLTSYVFHSTSGVAGDRRFETLPGVRSYSSLTNVLPATLSSWNRNDGLESSAPFTVFCNGVANQYWTSNPGASSGCHRNIGAWHDGEFICYPQGILSGGVTLQARQNLTFTVYNPMTGAVVLGPVTKNAGEQVSLAQGPGAYIIKGSGSLVPICAADEFTYPNSALIGNGGWYGSAPASRIEVVNGQVRLWGGAGSYDAIRSMNCEAGGSGYIPVQIKVYAGTGARTIWSFWIDDTSGKNLGRWYGTANSARGRIADTGDVTAEQALVPGQWNTLLAKIYPATNTTQFFFNGNDLGTLSHASQGAGDVLGRVRLESIDNDLANGHFLYFDDLTTEASDTTPPGPVANFVATPGDTQNSLSWTNPTDADFAGTMIRFSTAGFPGSPTGGTLLYDGTGTSTTHTGLTNGVTYYYSAFAYDGVPNYSGTTTASAVPADTTPPGPVSSFVATPGDAQNSLSWVNPGAADFAGVKIMFKTTGYPTGPTDGTQVYNGSGTSTTHTGLTNGVTYYYSAFAYDEVPNYSSAAQANAIPAGPEFCCQDEFDYPDGALVGQGGWTGNATASHIDVVSSFVRVFGGSQARNATKTINCDSSPTGFIWVRLLAYRGTGTSTMWNVWINDSGGKNLARWYGSGTTARGRIGSTGTVTAVRTLQGNGVWDSLVVKIDPFANTTQFFFNGEDLGVYSHGSQPGNAVGQVKIERENNGSAAGNFVYLDNIRVSPN